jgi:hypothetical protein
MYFSPVPPADASFTSPEIPHPAASGCERPTPLQPTCDEAAAALADWLGQRLGKAESDVAGLIFRHLVLQLQQTPKLNGEILTIRVGLNHMAWSDRDGASRLHLRNIMTSIGLALESMAEQQVLPRVQIANWTLRTTGTRRLRHGKFTVSCRRPADA